MESEFSEYVESFKKSFKEIKMCGDKIVEISAPTKKTLISFKTKVDEASEKLEKLFSGFIPDEKTISLKAVETELSKTQALKASCPLLNIDALGGTDKSEIGMLRTNISKLNLLLEASLKIKMLSDNRLPKIAEKFPEENLTELKKIASAITLLAVTINKEVSALNAQIGFILAKEMEMNSKVQTFDTIMSQLQKRFLTLN